MNEKIIEKYYNDLFRWSYAKTKNRFDAEDLTQEIIYQVIKASSKDNLIIDPIKYLWKIAYYTWCNKAKDYIKGNVIVNNELIMNEIKDDKVDIIKKIKL